MAFRAMLRQVSDRSIKQTGLYKYVYNYILIQNTCFIIIIIIIVPNADKA